ncbi:salivary glue protein Sgs-3-like [Eriocheir sinensis]|uniref:salivary glue protein Sgs-3-like n=1 Tax=Eriocheir sinensis TaxID=95602 RepID=UPI0021C95CD5|nr:salivary glue protein Sgs-3-like [Eriocheir sinensis]XP_050727697.1 salivary glue protein Sgs-3-like [Eriocheir sinensis]
MRVTASLLIMAILINRNTIVFPTTTNTGSTIIFPTNNPNTPSTITNTGDTIVFPTNTGNTIVFPTNTGDTIVFPTNTGNTIVLPTNTDDTIVFPTNTGRTIFPTSTPNPLPTTTDVATSSATTTTQPNIITTITTNAPPTTNTPATEPPFTTTTTRVPRTTTTAVMSTTISSTTTTHTSVPMEMPEFWTDCYGSFFRCQECFVTCRGWRVPPPPDTETVGCLTRNLCGDVSTDCNAPESCRPQHRWLWSRGRGKFPWNSGWPWNRQSPFY